MEPAPVKPRGHRQPGDPGQDRVRRGRGCPSGSSSIPLVFINGKQVPRWKLDNENLLPRMVREAAQSSTGFRPMPS